MNEYAVVVQGLTRRFGEVLAVDEIDAVAQVEAHGNELTISVTNALVRTVASALNDCGVKFRRLPFVLPRSTTCSYQSPVPV